MTTSAGRIVVAKVGGSLLAWPPLPDRLARFLADRRGRNERVVLIAGGGGAADWVREFDRVHAPGDEVAHALAVRSLDLTAHALAVLVSDSEVVTSRAAIGEAWKAGRVPILAPRLMLDEDDRTSPDPLPQTWDATTDAIAARLAALLGADELALLKSTSAPPGTTRDNASRLGLVDSTFPRVSRGLVAVVVVNLRDEAATETSLD
jgi:5-(aminomethyl)-3-furanmethanol phosphate kinase